MLIINTSIFLDWIILNYPFLPLLFMIDFILQMPGNAHHGAIYLFLTLLPSLMMLAGLIAKQRGYNLKESKIMRILKDQVSKFKKESLEEERINVLWVRIFGAKMSKNDVIVVKNNLIAIAVHICICLIFFIPLLFLSFEDGNNTVGWLICTLIILFLYFWAGRKLLSETHSVLINVFSVIGPVILSLTPIIFLLLYGLTYGLTEGIYTDLVIYLVLASLPSLIMLAGMMTKNQVNEFKVKLKEFSDKGEMRIKERIPKNMLILIQVILNNLIAIVIHICLSFLFLIIIILLYSFTPSFNEILGWLIIGAVMLMAFFLYFGAGKEYLKAHNTLINIFSVLGLLIMLIVITYSLDDVWESGMNLPFEPLFWIITYIFQMPYGAADAKYISLVLAPLPSLMMLAGLMVKQKGYNFKESKIMRILKNQANKFKKEP